MLVVAKPLAHPPLESIPPHSIAGFPARGQPQPTITRGARRSQISGIERFFSSRKREDHQIPMRSAPTLPHDPTKITGIQKPVRAPKGSCRLTQELGLGRHSGGESPPALGAPSLQNLSPRLGLHALSKAMFAQSLDPTRLKSPLHLCGSFAVSRSGMSNRLNSLSRDLSMPPMPGESRGFIRLPSGFRAIRRMAAIELEIQSGQGNCPARHDDRTGSRAVSRAVSKGRRSDARLVERRAIRDGVPRSAGAYPPRQGAVNARFRQGLEAASTSRDVGPERPPRLSGLVLPGSRRLTLFRNAADPIGCSRVTLPT